MELNVRSRLLVSAAAGLLVMAGGITGCSMFSPTKAPIDCDLVKTQEQAGKSDAQIAADLNATYNQRGLNYTQISESDVTACHGPETSGNKSSGMIPSNY